MGASHGDGQVGGRLPDVLSNLVGHDSHGIVRLLQYSDWTKKGQIQPDAEATVASASGAVATVDGAWGFGQPAAQLATALASQLASANGVAAVAISACNHVGRLGEYVATIADQGQMGLAFCNSGPVVAPFGGAGRVMGTILSPGRPRSRDGPVVLDFATAKIAEGKVKIALAEGHTVPPGSIIDSEGRPSTEPEDLYNGGALLAFGEHKGSGMSMLIELTAGLVSMMGTSCDPAYLGGNGTLILALDIAAFGQQGPLFRTSRDILPGGKAHWRRSSRRRNPSPRGLEAQTLEARRSGGVVVPAEIRRQVSALADELAVDVGSFSLR